MRFHLFYEIFIPLLFVFIIESFSEGNSYVFSFGHDEDDFGESIAITSDGGYILAGRTGSWGSYSWDFLVTKISKSGSIEWINGFGDFFALSGEYAFEIIEVRDGNFVLVGESGVDTFLSTIVKVSSENGTFLWKTWYDRDPKLRLLSVVENPSTGNLFAVGYLEEAGGDYELFVMKYDEGGNVIDHGSFYVAGKWIRGISARFVSDGIVIFGWTNYRDDSYRDPLILKISFSINEVDAYAYGQDEDYEIASRGISLPNDPNNLYAFTGYDETNLCFFTYLIANDMDGEELEVCHESNLVKMKGITETSNGDFLLVGGYRNATNDYGVLARIIKNGTSGMELAWVKYAPYVEVFNQAVTSSWDEKRVAVTGKTKDGDVLFAVLSLNETICNMTDITNEFSIRKFNSSHDVGTGVEKRTYTLEAHGNYNLKYNPVITVVSSRISCVTCNGYPANSGKGCSNHGVCKFIDTCECNENYTLAADCSRWECFGVGNNPANSSQVCGGGYGKCIGHNHCNCTDYNDRYGLNCDQYGCVGGDLGECSSHGICDEYSGACDCFANYSYAADCSVYQCFGVFSNDSSNGNLCSGHGQCIGHNNCSCSSISIYFGFDCGIFTCNHTLSNDVQNVCNGHGTCVDHNKCNCSSIHYQGDYCSKFECYDELNTNTEKVCSGHGDCIGYNNCSCSRSYPGLKCDDWGCHGESRTDYDVVCAGNGLCVDIDSCFCFPGYSSLEMGGSCTEFQCGKEKKDSHNVCNKRGVCLSSQQCTCFDDYEGDFCETWSCNGVDYKITDVTCNGNGKCKEPNDCKCKGGFAGEYCATNTLYYSVMTPILLVSSSCSFLALIVCCVIFCCICCAVLAVSVLTILRLVVTVKKQTQGLKKFGKLRNFNLLLKEQELDDDGSMARLKFNRSLFEIEMDDIKTLEILGEGGSNSVVFKALWNGKHVAFKCFKTRTLMSTQDSFDEFEKEVEILSSVAHPNIIRFFGATLKPPRVGIVMELCSKGELLDYVVNFRNEYNTEYPFFEKMRMLTEVCSAIEFLHSKNIIHRDLKCENVLISEDEHAKLMDFGLSRCVESMSIQKTTRIGTNIYMSPEIVTSATYNEKCDVFSLGIMIYILLTENAHPYSVLASDEFQIELKVANDPKFRPNLVSLKLPEDYQWLKELIPKCWDHDPSKRYHCKEVREILETKGSIEAFEKKNIIKSKGNGIYAPTSKNLTMGGGSEQRNGDEVEMIRKLREEMEVMKNDNQSLRYENSKQTKLIEKLRQEIGTLNEEEF